MFVRDIGTYCCQLTLDISCQVQIVLDLFTLMSCLHFEARIVEFEAKAASIVTETTAQMIKYALLSSQ